VDKKRILLPNLPNYKATTVSKSRNAQFARLPHYQAYILRFWQESSLSQEETTWRFTLINTNTNSEYGFASFQELIVFLENQINAGESK